MQENSLVSIIMPVYKVEKYIEESVKSIIRQTYKNIELILVDDGSPDASIEKATKILETSEIQYKIVHQENAGQGMARNAGMATAQGDWIYFLDSDDLISDNAIEHMIYATASKNVDLVFSGFNNINDTQNAIRSCESKKVRYMSAGELQMAFLKRTIVVLTPGSLYRKDFLSKNSLKFEPIPWSEDQHFVWRVLYHINVAAFVSEPLYQYLKHPGSIMAASKANAMVESYRYILELKKYYSDKGWIANYIVPRWVMGTMNAGCNLLTWKRWKKLWSEIDGRKNFRILLSFPDMKVRTAAYIAYVSPLLYYRLMRRKGVHKYASV